MATTIYNFQADLTQLLRLNRELEKANATLLRLKSNTAAYGKTSKQIGSVTTAMNTNSKAMKSGARSASLMNKQGNKMVSIFKSASIAIASAFAFRAIIGGIRGVITSFADFESQMSAVKAISGATNDEFERLKSTAEQLGRTTVFTATQVAQLQEEYARLGFTADEIVQAQAGTIDLAAATGESLKSSAETAGAVIRAFGLDAKDTTTVVDVMGASFTSSALNLEKFRQSMKFVAPVAKAAGFTLEETSAMLAQLANNGLSGSIAGNALKNIMLRLGDANSTLNKKLGKTVQGLPQFVEALKQMKDESFGLTEATELLDKRSAPAFLALIGNIEGLEGSLETLNNAEGAVTRMAAIRLDNLEGDFTLLKSATEGLGIAIGEIFNVGLRNSVDSLTIWIQELTKSKTAMKVIQVAMNTLVVLLGMVTLRFAALRLATIASSFSITGMAKGVRLLAISMRGLTTGTMTTATAMKGLKVAIASTGVGVLAVAIGTLIGFMMTLGEETSETVMQMNRLHRAFSEDIDSAIELNEADNERVNVLRKLKAEYPDLLKNLDIETASNLQLLEVKKLIADTATERGEIAKREELIKLAYEQEEIDLKELRLTKIRQEAFVERMQKERDAGDKSVTFALQRAKLAVKESEKRIRIRKNETKKEEKRLNDENKVFIKSLNKKFRAADVSRELDTRKEKQYRKKLSDGYLKDLEDFRNLAKLTNVERANMTQSQINSFTKQAQSKQLNLIKESQAELKFAQDQLQYAKLTQRALKGTSKQRTQAAKVLQTFKDSMSKERLENIKSTKSFALVGIKVQELRKLLVNLDAALIKSGKSKDKSVLSVQKLNATKDRLKELLKLQTNAIVDINKKEVAEIENSFKAKKQKYEKEKGLIVANQKTIAFYQNGQATNQDALNKKFIKSNIQKYDVLKNLDKAGFDKLFASSFDGMQRRESMLIGMEQEELKRFITNKDVLLAINKEKDLLLLRQDIKNRQRNLDAYKGQADFELDTREKGALSIFKNQEEAQRNLAELSVMQDVIIEDQVKAGVITRDEGNLAILENERAFHDALNKMEDDRLNKIKDVYSQISQTILDFSANRAEVESQRVNEQAAKEVQITTDKFERELEIAEKAGIDTEGMQRKHDQRIRHLEEKKANDLREIQRKQFMLKKANDIAMAVINGALAITKVTAQTGIGAIAAAPLTSAMIAAQIAAISSRQFVGEKGGITPTKSSEGSLDKFATGGMVIGNSHAQGGEKFATGGRVVELEGGEAVINKRSTAIFKPMLSQINSHKGFGKKFAQGGLTPGMTSTMDNARNNFSQNDIANLISDSINSQQVFVTESDISSSQSVVNIIESQSSIF